MFILSHSLSLPFFLPLSFSPSPCLAVHLTLSFPPLFLLLPLSLSLSLSLSVCLSASLLLSFFHHYPFMLSFTGVVPTGVCICLHVIFVVFSLLCISVLWGTGLWKSWGVFEFGPCLTKSLPVHSLMQAWCVYFQSRIDGATQLRLGMYFFSPR